MELSDAQERILHQQIYGHLADAVNHLQNAHSVAHALGFAGPIEQTLFHQAIRDAKYIAEHLGGKR